MEEDFSKSKPVIRLKKKLGIETLWIFLLAELKDSDDYPYSLRLRIREKFGFDPGTVMPYVVLKKLERDGYVSSYKRDGKRYYRITERGVKLLNSGINYLKKVIYFLEH
ncbi:MAG TPA: PadR family transcriptional regulator [Thermoproteales archaeon]|nr:PadR family transcriptional regulator [Thermoproteales archaeon]